MKSLKYALLGIILLNSNIVFSMTRDEADEQLGESSMVRELAENRDFAECMANLHREYVHITGTNEPLNSFNWTVPNGHLSSLRNDVLNELFEEEDREAVNYFRYTILPDWNELNSFVQHRINTGQNVDAYEGIYVALKTLVENNQSLVPRIDF